MDCLTFARPKGEHNVKNLRDSFVINLFRTPFSEKKEEWTKNLFQSKKMKKIYGAVVPRTTELGQNQKKYFQKYQFAGLLAFHHMKR